MSNLDPGSTKYSEEDSKSETGATDREQYSAWHQAREDFVNSYGDGTRSSLDPSENSSGYEDAFGKVGGELPD